VADAVTKDPKNPEVFMTYGTMLRLGGKPDQALAAFDKALKLKPDHRNAHIEKAYVEISRGKYAEAQKEIDAAEKSSPGALLVTYTRALNDFSQGKFAAAQESLQKVLKSCAGPPPSVLLAGASELNLGTHPAGGTAPAQIPGSQSERHLCPQAAGPDPAQAVRSRPTPPPPWSRR
jgi:tetratricopeptide (TPR) repeat protein